MPFSRWFLRAFLLLILIALPAVFLPVVSSAQPAVDGPTTQAAPEAPNGTRRSAPAPVRSGSDALTPPPSAARRTPTPAGTPGTNQTTEFLAGSTTVSVVFVESNGGSGNCSGGDTQTENWDLTRRQNVISKINEGLGFWTSRANAPKPLRFQVDDRGVRTTSCEPITRPNGSNDQGLWIADVLSGLGYAATPDNYFDQARSYADDRRKALGTDWGYTVFVIDSLNDVDGSFANNRSGYAYLNGPFAVLTYDNGGWGIDRFNKVLAHETGHIFGAMDEYVDSGCSPTLSYGYLNVPNASCNNGGVSNDVSLMGEGSELDTPGVDLSASARSAVGWRNPAPGTGSGAVVDVVRTATAALTPYSPDPALDDTPTFAATAGNTAFPPGNGHAPVSISTVASAEQNLDGGSWTASGVAPGDGTFDGESEPYTMTPATPVSRGTHTFGTRSVNDFGYVSAAATDSLTIGSGGGNPLITENFDGGAQAFSVISGGTWAADSGRYVLTKPADSGSATANSNISVHNTDVPGDFTLTASAATTATSSAFNDFSVIFDYRNATNYYFASFSETNDANTSGIFRVVNGARTQLADITTTITAGTRYPIRIEREGSAIRVFRSGALAAGASDTTFTGGRVGFGSRNDGGSFDDLVVTASAPPAFSTPGAPSAATATAGDANAAVSWTAPASDGGAAITSYAVTASPGGAAATVAGSARAATVTGLTNGVSYTFTVVATNSVGAGPASAPSNAVTPAVGGSALINETFTSSAANFTKISGGKWAVSGGRYVLSSPADGGTAKANSNLSVHKTTVTGDFALTARASTTPTSSAFNDFSIVFGYRDASNYYFASFSESNDANTSGIFKVAGGVRTQLADITSSITAGTLYPIRIERQGTAIRVYRAGSLAATADDGAFTSGRVGFGSRNDGATFDDLSVTTSVPAPVAAPGGPPVAETGSAGFLEELWAKAMSLLPS